MNRTTRRILVAFITALLAPLGTLHADNTREPARPNILLIAGEDKKWVWADAVIDGQTVVVSSPEVPKPVAVRYAYRTNPEGCNLYNNEGLPASPFRTDES